MGLVFSILCFVHIWIPRLKIKPKLSPPRQTGLQAQGRGQCSPALPSGHQETSSRDLWGHPRHPGYVEASSKIHRDLRLQALRDGSPSQPGGEMEKPQ